MNSKLKKIFNKADKNDNKWYNIDKSGKIPQIDIIGEIGDYFDGVTAKEFRNDINELDVDEINIYIDSPGGYIFEGMAIYDALIQHKAQINMTVGSIAASIASVILMAADKITMFENSEFMIHDPWSISIGTAEDFRKEADFLDRLKSKILGIYEARLGIDKDQLSEMMKEETWIDGSEANEMGFVDELIENKKAAACAFDLSIFNKVPERLEKRNKAMNKRELEKSLRELGYSKSEAIQIAGGPENQSDSEDTPKAEIQSDSDFSAILDSLDNLTKERD